MAKRQEKQRSTRQEKQRSTRQEKQSFIRYYRETTGEREIDMHKVAELAEKMGWKMPMPPSPTMLLARQFAEAAREETKYSSKTGRPYRVYHAIPVTAQMDLFHYVDIDEATRSQMLKSLVLRREQMVSDGVNLTDDSGHWNASHPEEEPIDLPMDLALDIEIRKAADEQDDEEEPPKAA